MRSKVHMPVGDALTPAQMAAGILSLNPDYNPPPSRHQIMAETLITLGERALAMNPIRLAPAPWRSAKSSMTYASLAGAPDVRQTVQPGSFDLAQGFGSRNFGPEVRPAPKRPAPKQKRRPRKQPERVSQTLEDRARAGIGSAAQAVAGSGPSFDDKAPWIMHNLQRDFGLTREQAAGILGNLGHESGGFQHFQEIGSGPRSGGRGWAQWTGPRRIAFLRWARERGLDPRSDHASYEFLRHELMTTERRALDKLREQKTVSEATIAFERAYERAGTKHDDSRLSYAQKAFDAPRLSSQPLPVYPNGKPEGVE